MKDNKDRKDTNTSSLGGFKFLMKRILISIAIFGVGYAIIYFLFLPEGFIPTGSGLGKSDWLSFLGGYLSFSGAIIVSLTLFWHANYTAKKEEIKSKEERKKKVQPIFSINIISKNGGVMGTVDTFNINDIASISKHENLLISIENVNEYPIKHVIAYEKYLCPVLKAGSIINVQCAYAGTSDAKKHPDKLAVITEEDYAKNEEGYPTGLTINYEDVDGREMWQIFKLKSYDGTLYFSLEKTEEL